MGGKPVNVVKKFTELKNVRKIKVRSNFGKDGNNSLQSSNFKPIFFANSILVLSCAIPLP